MASVVREFWAEVGDGRTAAEAGAAVGVSEATGVRWFRDAGGVKPRLIGPKRSGSRPRLSLQDPMEIEIGVKTNKSLRSIGSQLTPPRPASTIKREIDTNGVNNRYDGRKSGYRRKEAFGARQSGRTANVEYRALVAQARSDQRARRPKPGKPAVHEMRVSHETIYHSIYVQGKRNLRRELHTCLRTGRALRKPQRRPSQRRGRIPDMVNISERPAEVEDRAVPGHWEGDLILGSVASGSAIGTVVERTTRFVMLLHLPEDHGAAAVQAAIVPKMAALPAILRKTLTWDQGKEMTNHAAIADAAELDIYFCDPYSPWQRGSNENTNGLLRQYFPKGTDLSVFPADYLDYVAAKLNIRPRETLGWKTPAEALDELLSNPFKPPAVASTA